DLDALRALAVAPGVALEDVARIERVYEDKQYVYRMNDRPGVFVSVYKTSDANVVDTSRHLQEALARAQHAEPALEGFGFHTFFDQGDLIESSLKQLQISAMLGGLLAV